MFSALWTLMGYIKWMILSSKLGDFLWTITFIYSLRVAHWQFTMSKAYPYVGLTFVSSLLHHNVTCCLTTSTPPSAFPLINAYNSSVLRISNRNCFYCTCISLLRQQCICSDLSNRNKKKDDRPYFQDDTQRSRL